ncbi:MAG: hypothetical protein JNK14_15365 [Chitinophagaceae bacterium]|nr:hypothetical protein [Chitinophagaceae bacterium]
MRSVFLFLLILSCSLSLVAQSDVTSRAADPLKEEQNRFLHYVHNLAIDSNIVERLTRFAGPETDSIRHAIAMNSLLAGEQKAAATRSVMYLLQELQMKMAANSLDIYSIPPALESFKSLLSALMHDRPFFEIIRPLGPDGCQLMAASFWQYDESAFFKDVALYKRVASSPDNILYFLEKNPGFRFADSLLFVVATNDPISILRYLRMDKPGLRALTERNRNNIYLQQLLSLVNEPYASELIPFTVPLAEKRTDAATIIRTREDANAYFRLLVRTLQDELKRPPDSSSAFLPLLRKGIKKKAFSFYVNRVNEQHGMADNARFAAVKNLRMEELFYVITSCEEELYTSSYIGLYKRLMEHFHTQPADSLFRAVSYDNFHRFIHMAASYNMLADFLGCMSYESASAIMHRFISGIESDSGSGLEKAMDVADSFAGLDSLHGVTEMISRELSDNLERCHGTGSYLGIRLYSILSQVFELVREKNSDHKLWTRLGNQELLQQKALKDSAGIITQLVLFYGDDDGLASYKNFLALFSDSLKWQVSSNDHWLSIRSLCGGPFSIYANLPLDNYYELDLRAQDSLMTFLLQHSLQPSVLIHRGHSYHLHHTLKRLQPSVRLAILGSCGGYNSILSVANINPDAQIIVSKKTGSKFINDPIIELINQSLQDEMDIAWPSIWSELRTRFSRDELLQGLFNEYIPPSGNISLFVLKLFNYYRRTV